MRINNNPIVRDIIIVAGFWWCVLSVHLAYQVYDSSYSLVENYEYYVSLFAGTAYHMKMWFAGAIVGAIFGLWIILFKRTQALNRVSPSSYLGIHTTMGKVPFLAKAAPRVKGKKVLPVTSKVITGWLDANRVKYPHHVAMFNAIWETLSAQPDHPASPYRGGHGGLRLWQHSQNVAEQALLRAKDWKYEGIFYKERRQSSLIIPKRDPDYLFNANDPLIPLIAIAHDLGKLEVYIPQPDGSVKSLESGKGGIRHDARSAQMLSRIPEFWAIPSEDRWALGRVVAQYHNTLKMRVDKSGACFDDRIGSLVQFLLDVDQATGMMESGAKEGSELVITDEDVTKIYTAFVEIVTEHGRINGTGDKQKDKHIKIGQKHDGIIYIREQLIRELILSKIGLSKETGPAKFKPTIALLQALEQKGLFYATVNGVDFRDYLPLQTIAFHDEAGRFLATWHHVIGIRLHPGAYDLMPLSRLPNYTSKVRVQGHFYGHQPHVKGDIQLLEMLRAAFGQDMPELGEDCDDPVVDPDVDIGDTSALSIAPAGQPSTIAATPKPTAIAVTPPVAPVGEEPEVILDSVVVPQKHATPMMEHQSHVDDILGDLPATATNIDIFTGRTLPASSPAKTAGLETLLDTAGNSVTPPTASERPQLDPFIAASKPMEMHKDRIDEYEAKFSKSLDAWNSRKVEFFSGRRKAPKRSADSFVQIQEAIGNGQLFVLHTHNGNRYVELSKVEALFPEIDIGSLLEAQRVTKVEVANIVALGVPEKV